MSICASTLITRRSGARRRGGRGAVCVLFAGLVFAAASRNDFFFVVAGKDGRAVQFGICVTM